MSPFRLEKEPFPTARNDEFYFSTPALAARRDELRNAIERGHVLLVDEQASGKSTMLGNLADSGDERWRIFRVHARARMSAKDFVHELVSTFGLPTREPPAARLRDADALLELLTARSKIAVILIDDAHRLERNALEQLLYLARRWQQYSIRFLISAEPQLTAQLESLQDYDKFPGSVASFGMPRFDHEQVGDYLHLCLFRAGLVGDSPFDPGVVAIVTEKAHGLVGAIDPIARELLHLSADDGCKQDCGRRGERMKVVARRWPVAIVAAAGLGVLLTVAVPGSATSQMKARSLQHLGGFQSSITLAPQESVEDIAQRSASANSFVP